MIDAHSAEEGRQFLPLELRRHAFARYLGMENGLAVYGPSKIPHQPKINGERPKAFSRLDSKVADKHIFCS